MQLGTRWTLGDTPPTGLPDVVIAAVRTVEDELKAEDVDTHGWRWTLTWLERLPIIELDDGTIVTFNPVTGTATIRQHDDEDPTDD